MIPSPIFLLAIVPVIASSLRSAPDSATGLCIYTGCTVPSSVVGKSTKVLPASLSVPSGHLLVSPLPPGSPSSASSDFVLVRAHSATLQHHVLVVVAALCPSANYWSPLCVDRWGNPPSRVVEPKTSPIPTSPTVYLRLPPEFPAVCPYGP